MEDYKSKYDHSRRIAEEICRIMENGKMELPENDSPAIREFAENDPNAAELLTKMANAGYISNELERYNLPDDQKAAEALITRLRKNKNRKSRYRIIYAASTAAVLLFAFGLWRIAIPQKYSISPFIPTELATPTLITDDGRQFDLAVGNQNLDNISSFIAINEEGLLHINNGNNDANSNEIIPVLRLIVPDKCSYTLTLEDGTHIILNANSELTYPSRFTMGNREVKLRGEAWFNVKQDAARPFMVNLDGITAKVYGTEFNINSNKSGHVDILLVSGSLGIAMPQEDEIILKKGELLRYDKENKNAKIENVDTESYLAWKDGFFMTNLQPLGELMDDISSWYGISFTYRNPDILKTKISVMINRDMDMDSLLESLQFATGIKITKDNNGAYEVK